MPSPGEETSGGQPAKKSGRSISATYAELVKPLAKPENTGDVIAALNAAVAPDEEWKALPIERDDDTTIDVGTESIAPEALPSEAVDVTDLLDEVNARVEADDPAEESPEGSEYARSVDNSGISAQFRAAGGTPSDLPPPPVETSTGASADEDIKQEILNKLKIDLNLVLPNSTPTSLLNKVNGVVFGDFWPPNELDVRRVISLLFNALALEEYNDNEKFLKTPLEDLRALLKAELDLRRAKKADALPLPNFHKKRRGPPPLPR